MEALLVHLQLRFYGQEDSMEYIFHFNHTQFLAAIVAGGEPIGGPL
jgi:hypothetical protein